MCSRLRVAHDRRGGCHRTDAVRDQGRCGSMSISPCHISRFSPEFQLACACCRVTPSEGDWVSISRLLPQIDVPAFLDLVIKRHWIGPLVHSHFRRLPAESLPPGLMEALATEARRNAVRALRAVRTHVLLARWLAEARIEWVPFKGISVARPYYGDITLRHVNDLDVLVRPASLDGLRQVLSDHGFTWNPLLTNWDLAGRGPRHREFLMRFYIEELHSSADLGQIDVHWKLTEGAGFFNLSLDQVLEGGDRLALEGVDLRVMNPVDLLLYLCEHGGRHCWARLKWLADLPQLLEWQVWDWPAVMRRASDIRCTQSLVLALVLAQELFGWRAPAPLQRILREQRTMDMLCSIVRTALFTPNEVLSGADRLPLGWLLRSQLCRALLGNWRAAYSVVWNLSLSPNDLRVVALPDRYFALYRIARPFLFAFRRLTVRKTSGATPHGEG